MAIGMESFSRVVVREKELAVEDSKLEALLEGLCVVYPSSYLIQYQKLPPTPSIQLNKPRSISSTKRL
jgi:hypothetical protein